MEGKYIVMIAVLLAIIAVFGVLIYQSQQDLNQYNQYIQCRGFLEGIICSLSSFWGGVIGFIPNLLLGLIVAVVFAAVVGAFLAKATGMKEVGIAGAAIGFVIGWLFSQLLIGLFIPLVIAGVVILGIILYQKYK